MPVAEGISPATTLSTPLGVKPGATVKGAASAKVLEAAKETEATFLSMLLKEMRETLDPEGGLFPGDSGDVQGGLFDLYMSKHLADAGGVGMAAALVRQMQATGVPRSAHTTDALTPPTPTPDQHAPPAPRK
jgi:flagellar protein FlgJ